ncbi:MAG: M28 family peptidase [Chloroflexota bacterium]
MTNVDITLEQQLIGQAWTSPDIYSNLAQLCDFGSRFGGTESEAQARDWLLQTFQQYGLTTTRLESFTYTGWYRGLCEVTVEGPQIWHLQTPISLVYSPATDETGLNSEVIDLGMGAEADFARYGDQVVGKIVLVSSASPSNGLWIHRREKYGRAVDYGAAGFIFMNHLPGFLAPTGSLRPGRLGEIPAIGVGHEEGFRLQRWCKQGPVKLKMRLQNDTRPTEASHVLGEVEGETSEVIIVGAHYDGHDISQGAMDDGSGVALLLEMARLFAPLTGQLQRTLRFIAFAVEELGVLGSTEYVHLHQAETDEWALMVNLDGGVGSAAHGFSTTGFAELVPLLKSFSHEMDHPLIINDRIGTATDAFPFFMAGVPALNLIAKPRNPTMGRGYGHTAADTLDKVNPLDLKATAAILARTLLKLADYDYPLAQHRSPEQLKQTLIQHNLEKPLKAQDKWPFT